MIESPQAVNKPECYISIHVPNVTSSDCMVLSSCIPTDHFKCICILPCCIFIISVIRTLTGHKSSIRSLDFHPYGDYAASGSLDYNIKVFYK